MAYPHNAIACVAPAPGHPEMALYFDASHIHPTAPFSIMVPPYQHARSPSMDIHFIPVPTIHLH
eukprot:8137807-Prorocentrum_lima.AAC.1